MADEPNILTTEPVTEPVTEPKNWYSDENAEVVKRTGWNGPDDAIKSYRNMEKMSSGMAKLPTPETSAKEIRAFYQKTGCPENPEGYEITAPEGLESLRDEGIESAIKQIAYDQGVPKQAFESIVKGYYEKLNADMHASREAGELALKTEFAKEGEYDEVVTIANRFFDTCSPEFCELMKASGLANNAIVVKEFMNKGKQTMSDTLVKGTVEGEKKETPTIRYPNSPEMYASGEDDESKAGRAYHEAKGFKYATSPTG